LLKVEIVAGVIIDVLQESAVTVAKLSHSPQGG
jgi:hypothetical protein